MKKTINQHKILTNNHCINNNKSKNVNKNKIWYEKIINGNMKLPSTTLAKDWSITLVSLPPKLSTSAEISND